MFDEKREHMKSLVDSVHKANSDTDPRDVDIEGVRMREESILLRCDIEEIRIVLL